MLFNVHSQYYQKEKKFHSLGHFLALDYKRGYVHQFVLTPKSWTD